MNKSLSIYLDLVRASAALVVFAGHVVLLSGCYAGSGGVGCRFAAGLFPFHLAHSAVVLFFVLSGYVITYVAAERETRLRDFAVSRFARIYSVAAPAMVLTLGIDLYLMSVGQTSNIPIYQYSKLWEYFPMFLTFSNNFWFVSEPTLSDIVMWSLCYEVWYYVLFASVFYFERWRRWTLASLIFAVIGFKLWALLPTWVLGSIVYKFHRKYDMKPAAARLLFFATLGALLLSFHFTMTSHIDEFVDGMSGGWISTHMDGSEWFVGDIVIALLFSANVFAANFARLEFGRLTAPIRLVASFSFTLYVIHWPLLELLLVYLKIGVVHTIVAVLLSVAALGLVTERQNHRLRKLIVNSWGVSRFSYSRN
ncbi:MAG TPA: acyltransferase [Stellaceae bacterium]|jgi:peptidoglycan/LPS O-acetylase OafA/YrhL